MKMKKLLFILIIILAFKDNLFAQFEKGDNVASAGIGIGGAYTVFGGISSQSPTFGIGYERGIFDKAGPGNIGIGGYIGHKSFRKNYNWGYEKLGYTIVGASGSYHWQFHKLKELDTYAGLLLAMNFATAAYHEDYNYFGYSPAKYNSYLSATFFVGGRYYFTPAFAGYSELSYGISFLTLGVAYKF